MKRLNSRHTYRKEWEGWYRIIWGEYNIPTVVRKGTSNTYADSCRSGRKVCPLPVETLPVIPFEEIERMNPHLYLRAQITSKLGAP